MEARGGKVAPDELRKQISFMGRGPGLGRACNALNGLGPARNAMPSHIRHLLVSEMRNPSGNAPHDESLRSPVHKLPHLLGADRDRGKKGWHLFDSDNITTKVRGFGGMLR